MEIDLTGKVVMVTGAARGIGAAIVRAVAASGGDVIAHDIRAEGGLSELKAGLGNRCQILIADLATEQVVPNLFQKALGWKGRIDVLVNNAGIYEQAPIDSDFDIWAASWARTLTVNLISAAHLCREAILHFHAMGRGGIIINMASRAAFRGDLPDYMNYAASKGGMIAMTRTIARALGAEGILAYAIAPGFVRTELNASFFREFGEEPAARETALGEIAAPEDIASFVVFLASGIAKHATGATFDINGASYVR
jgi:3-oxoacyl-[acyl-carrier protein] reductase